MTTAVNNFTAATATATGTSSTSSTASTSATSATQAYNTFLTLLTTQLKNQDPLNPTDTTQFTSEMIQLSEVEQQLQTNSDLSGISSSLSSLTTSNGLGYLGKTVTATGSTADVQTGSGANWNYDLSTAASKVSLSVQNSSGATVWSGTGDTTAGSHALSWNGTDSSGDAVPTGDYTLTVSALDAAGNTVSNTTSVVGKVTGVDTSGTTPSLQIGDVSYPLTNVTGLTN
jgi:flagellar basal-body rod modification protein FlgD